MIGSINNECGLNAESKLPNGPGNEQENGLQSGLDNTAITQGTLENAESCMRTIDAESRGDDPNAGDHWAEENVNNLATDPQAGSASNNVIKSEAPEERTVICDRCYLSKRPEPLSIFAGDLCILTEFHFNGLLLIGPIGRILPIDLRQTSASILLVSF